ncbi:MAG: phosphate regulon transcriptional regulatory protein PhoB [Gammaproteobacteria bacterium]|nr:MAG: phosphate regulon transcriptional regulatory protein PhoB [Gammaproteobacteria bacterium]
MPVKVLLVEDEEPIREMLRYSLENHHYTVLEAGSAKQAREILLTNRPDIIIVDWMMPGESGIEFIKRLKKDEILSDIPTMMLTARVEEMDKVRGLESGADDYMTKPVGIREFQARIKALLRRSSPTKNEQRLELLGIQLNLATHQLHIDGQRLPIGSTEFNLLKFFLTHKNKIYSRSQLLDFVWGQGVYLEERTVDVHMLRLRKILTPNGKQHHLVTVRGMGYMFSDGKI